MSRPLSILYFSNSLVRAGAEEHILTLLHGLDRQLFRAHFVCMPEVAEQVRRDVPGDVQLTALRLRHPRHVGAALRLGRLLKAEQIDILHAHLFYASVFAAPIGRLCRVPVMIETPHLREHWRHGWLKGRFFVDRLVGRLVDRYIAVSEANARYLVGQKGLPVNKIVTIRNGCDVTRFAAHRPAPIGLRETLGFRPEDPVLVVLARLEPQKGHRVLLDALPTVLQQFASTRLVCVGEGSLRRELQTQAHALGVSEAVRFVGYQANVADWLALADISVLPSLYEGLPLAVLESLCAGRPVVATAVDGTPEVVVDGRTGLTVEPGEAAALADAICRLLRDPDERRRLAHAGRAWVEERFDQRRQVRETQDLYLAEFERRVPVNPVPMARGTGRHFPKPEMVSPAQGVTAWGEEESRNREALKATICKEATRLCTEEYAGRLRAIVLTGSLARDEATWVVDGDQARVLGDAEFLLVFADRARLPAAYDVHNLGRQMEHRLDRRAVQCPMRFTAVHGGYLRALPPHIFTYELQTCGQVVWGESGILSLIPRFAPADISLEDAWRLLCNRLVEHLEIASENAPVLGSTRPDAQYRTAKLYLDMATSLLVFLGVYEPTYRQREASLRRLAAGGMRTGDLPFPLPEFARRVSECTRWKLDGGEPGQGSPGSWEDANRVARLLWRWELARLTGGSAELSDSALLDSWIRTQPVAKRLRGWLHVLRKYGWHRGWRQWPRWARLARLGSPRQCVYAAAYKLASELPALLAHSTAEGDWGYLLDQLPVIRPPQRRNGAPGWHYVASEIVWNYREFLVDTRS